MESDLSKETRQIVIDVTGRTPEIHTQTCVEWKLEHNDCIGCQSELPCAQMAGLLIIMSESIFYTAKVLDAKTSEEALGVLR